MTIPMKLISAPHVDLDELEKTVAIQREALDGAEVKSRSTAMLEDAIQKELGLTEEHRKVQADRLRLEANIAILQGYATEYKTVEDDLAVELNAVNQIISLLKAAGVRVSQVNGG